MKKFITKMFLSLFLLLIMGSVKAQPALADTITWSGNGTTDGYCSKVTTDTNVTGQNWLFVLTSPDDVNTFTLTATFNPDSPKTISNGVQNGEGSIHFFVNTAIGAQLLSASATEGTANSVLTVSHCEEGVQPASLTVIKHVINDNGGTAVAGDFTMNVTGTNVSDTSFPGVESPGTTVTLDGGSYSVDEDAFTGYAKSLGTDCSGTIANGESKTCTITNDDISPQLTVIKHVVNDNGGTAVAGDFTMNVTGTNVSDETFSGAEDPGTTVTLNVGSYSVDESTYTGYSKGLGADCAGTIALGEMKAGGIGDDDIEAKLSLIKHVVNDNGGTLGVSDFPLFVGTTSVTSEIKNGFDAGSYIASETSQVGYSPSSWSGDCAANGSITLSVGDDKTCEITNDDIPGRLKIIKNTVGGNGTFNFTVSGPTALTPSITTSGGTGNTGLLTVNAGVYSAVEGTHTGWDLTGAICDSGTPASFTVPLDTTVTCTFENTKQGKITIIKDAKPNDCQDFAFSFTGKSSFYLDDDGGVAECEDTNRDQSIIFNNLAVSTKYTIAETLPNAFWEFGDVSCLNTVDKTVYDNTTAVTNGVTVSLNPGADVTCTFVNNKKGPTRTQGFWKTHTAYTTSVFSKYFAGGMQIGSAPHRGLITNNQSVGQSQLFGVYYSSIPKKSDGKTKRSEIDQARMQLLHQLVAAKLNCAAFGCSASIQNIINNADNSYATGPKESILNYAGLLDIYNNSGDTIILLGTPGKATPKTSQSLANIGFWDAP